MTDDVMDENLKREQPDKHGEKDPVPTGAETAKSDENQEKLKRNKKRSRRTESVATEAKPGEFKGFGKTVLAIVVAGLILGAAAKSDAYLTRMLGCYGTSFSSPPKGVELGIVIELDGASVEEAKGLANLLEDQLGVANEPGIGLLPTCWTRSAQDRLSDPNVFMVVRGHLQNHRFLKGGVLTSLNSDRTEQKIFHAEHDWRDLKAEVILKINLWLEKVSADLSASLLTDPDLDSPPQKAPNRLSQQLAVLASVSSLKDSCLLRFNRGMDALLNQRYNDAESNLVHVKQRFNDTASNLTNVTPASCPEGLTWVADYGLGRIRAHTAKQAASPAAKNDANQSAAMFFRKAASDKVKTGNPHLFTFATFNYIIAISVMPPDQLTAATLYEAAEMAYQARSIAGGLRNGLSERFLPQEKGIRSDAAKVQRWEQEAVDALNLAVALNNAQRDQDVADAAEQTRAEERERADIRFADFEERMRIREQQLTDEARDLKVQLMNMRTEKPATSTPKNNTQKRSRRFEQRLECGFVSRNGSTVNLRRCQIVRAASR